MPKLLRCNRDFQDAMLREVENWPGASITFHPPRTNGHPHAELTFRERRRKSFFSLSPSDNRARINQITMIRRVLKELGAERLK